MQGHIAARWRAFLFVAALLGGELTSAVGAAAPLEDIIPRVKRSVFAVGTYQRIRNPQFTFRGTGFAVGDGTLVATNAHVLPEVLDVEKSEAIVVVIPDRGTGNLERRAARIAALDKDHDVALLRIEGAALPPLVLGKTGEVREGEGVAFTGFPIGTVLGLVPVTHRATVSAVTPIALPGATARQLDQKVIERLKKGSFQVLQLDGTAYPGNSGSPLYDASNGEVLGIVNMVFVKGTKENVLSQPSGISFAVPVEHLRKLMESAL